ncbi:MAG: hypothetical protein ACT4NP_00185 [Pseudonocardiales bacterium]
MGRNYEIRVYGKRRKKVDPRQLAQLLILLGRHLYEQQQVKEARAERKADAGQPEEPSPESGIASVSDDE